MQSATTQKLQAILLGAAMLAFSPGVLQGQTTEQRARAEQNAHDKRHHNTAKTVGGTAAAGALIGGIAGGAPGALIGAGAGAGAGFVGDRVRKHYGTKKRARRMRERRAYRRHRAEY
jgi:predicted lipid-binding transport protein (Tim44 family)